MSKNKGPKFSVLVKRLKVAAKRRGVALVEVPFEALTPCSGSDWKETCVCGYSPDADLNASANILKQVKREAL